MSSETAATLVLMAASGAFLASSVEGLFYLASAAVRSVRS